MSAEAAFAFCFTWCFTLALVFFINWNNNSYEYYKVEEYLRTKSCYSATYEYNNAPRIDAYCDTRSLSELLGTPE